MFKGLLLCDRQQLLQPELNHKKLANALNTLKTKGFNCVRLRVKED
jgi:hypothetical protein